MSVDQLQSFKLRYDHAPLTMNKIRGMHWAVYSKTIDEYKQTFGWLAKVHHVPTIECVDIIVRHTYRHGAHRPDTVACAPALKAAVDGLVEAGVLIGDDPRFVHSVTFETPVKGQFDSMELELFEALQ